MIRWVNPDFVEVHLREEPDAEPGFLRVTISGAQEAVERAASWYARGHLMPLWPSGFVPGEARPVPAFGGHPVPADWVWTARRRRPAG